MNEVEQLTEEQAKDFYHSGKWKEMDLNTRAEFQMLQNRICMPFDEFHKSVEARLGRPVWTHEFAFRDRIFDEMFGDKPKPTLQEILELIPKEKRLVVVLPNREESKL